MRKFLKTVSALLILAILLTFVPYFSHPSEASGNIIIRINGCHIPSLDGICEISDGAVMAPFYDVFNYLGFATATGENRLYVEAKRSINGLTVSVRMYSTSQLAVINSQTVSTSHAIYTSDKNYTLFPVDIISHIEGYEWSYDSLNSILSINSTGDVLVNKLLRFDKICDESVLDCILNLFDPETGGFYYTESAKLNEPFGVNIESTAQALAFLSDSGIKPENVMPQKVINTLVSHIQSSQSAEDGYFYNNWQGTDVTQSKRERDFGYAVAILNRFGAEPLYPLPTERLSGAQTASLMSGTATLAGVNDYLGSEESFVAWLDSLDWSNPYSTGTILASSRKTILAAGYGLVMAQYVAAKQNPETGLWGDGISYDTTNGAMKLSSVFEKDIMPYPNYSKMIDSVVALYESDLVPPTICSVWNPLVLVHNAGNSQTEAVSDEDRLQFEAALGKIIDTTTENTMLFKQSDGGFSYWPEHGQKATHGSPSGLGLAEGDVDATYIATIQMRKYLYNLCSYKYIPPIYADYCAKAQKVFESRAKSENPVLTNVKFTDANGDVIAAPVSGKYNASLSVCSPSQAEAELYVAKYASDGIINSVSKSVHSLNAGVNILSTGITYDGEAFVRAFLWDSNQTPFGYSASLNGLSNEKSIDKAVFTVGGREYKGEINHLRRTVTVDLLLDDAMRSALKDASLTVEVTGELINRNLTESLNLTNREYVYTIQAPNGSKVDYTVKAELSDIQRNYNFNGAKLLAANHATKARRKAPAYLNSDKGVGMWYNEGYAFDSSGNPIESETYGTIAIVNRTPGNDCLELKKTKQGGSLGIKSVAGDAAAHGSTSKFKMSFMFNLENYTPNNDGLVYVNASGLDHVVLSCKNAPEGKYYIATRSATDTSHTPIEGIELSCGNWYELTYVFRKYPETESGYNIEIYLDNKFVCETNGSYKEDGLAAKPSGCLDMDINSSAQMHLRSWRNSLFTLKLDNFYCSAIKDIL